MKADLREKAIKFRRQGLSYSEILRRVPVAKSTLSLWLRSVGLSKRQKQRLTEKKLASMRRGWLRVQQIRVERSSKIKKQAGREVSNLIKNPLWLIGTVLYWAEGTKEKQWRHSEKVAFSNMDLEMHKLYLRWLKEHLGVKEVDLQYELYIHERANIEKAKKFWTGNLHLSTEELRIYFKKHKPKSSLRKNIGKDYNGLLRVWVVKSSDLNRKIAGWIEGVIEYFSK